MTHMSAQSPAGEEEIATPVLNEQLCFALYTATHRVIRAYRPLLEPLGLTYLQYLALLVLWERMPRSVGELGARLYLDSGTLTPLLKRMERSGLVTRIRDADDERRVLVYLTEDGQALRARAATVSDSLLCRTELSKDETRELHDYIMGLSEVFK